MNSTANKNHRSGIYASTISLRSPNPLFLGIVIAAIRAGTRNGGGGGESREPRGERERERGRKNRLRRKKRKKYRSPGNGVESLPPPSLSLSVRMSVIFFFFLVRLVTEAECERESVRGDNRRCLASSLIRVNNKLRGFFPFFSRNIFPGKEHRPVK